MITADNITTEQIRSVWEIGDNSISGRDLMDALAEPMPWGYPSPEMIHAARARCAEILNAREIERQEQERERRKKDLAEHNR